MRNYKKYYTLKASPADVYNALTNPLMLEIWTGEKAEMSEEPGSEFSLWDGSISGKNLEFEKNKKIVQQWYFEGQDEDSIVTIIIHPTKQRSQVELQHTNIPDEAFDNITDGWDYDYFAALKQLFE